MNSALQRARETVEERLPEQSQQATLRALGDDGLRELVDSYVDAWERGDVEAVVSMLDRGRGVRDAAARELVPRAGGDRVFLAGWPLSGAWRWRPARSRERPAGARLLQLGPDEERYLPFALNVLTLRGERISDVTAFIARSTERPPRVLRALPEQPADPMRLMAAFERFGLPERLDLTGISCLCLDPRGGVGLVVLAPGRSGAAGRGHDVVAPDLPSDDDSAGLSEYADAVVGAIGDRTDLIVVAQSLGEVHGAAGVRPGAGAADGSRGGHGAGAG